MIDRRNLTACLARRSVLRAWDVRAESEAGFTLVELILTLVVFTILLGMTIPIVATFMDASTKITNTYANINQILPVSTNLQRLIRSAVAPGPTYFTGIPVPAFGAYSLTTGAGPTGGTVTPTSLTFYANIGDPNGPAKIVASCTPNGTTGNCAYPGTFTVTEARAIAVSGASTCPFGSQDNQLCTWSSSPITLLTVTGLTNGLDNVPLFTYGLLITTTTTNSNGTQTTSSTTTSLTGTTPSTNAAQADYNLDLTTSGTLATGPSAGPNSNGWFTSCDAPPSSSPVTNPDSNCAAAEIESVTIDIQVNGTASNSRNGGGQVEDQSTVYLLSTSSSSYQEQVG
jgi:prepilin-type N-terminal cleavage/methylation domain-containing protein